MEALRNFFARIVSRGIPEKSEIFFARTWLRYNLENDGKRTPKWSAGRTFCKNNVKICKFLKIQLATSNLVDLEKCEKMRL